jgi:hypothetical protein
MGKSERLPLDRLRGASLVIAKTGGGMQATYRRLHAARAAGIVSIGLLSLATTVEPAEAQSPLMNFFLALRGPARADRLELEVSDTHCRDLAYAQGFGHLTWRAYLDGSPGVGQGHIKARDRIGQGPWYNYHGVLIAENLAQLHSDENNLWHESAVTVTGELAPRGAIEIPWGSELDGSDFSRRGPFFCFGIPG